MSIYNQAIKSNHLFMQSSINSSTQSTLLILAAISTILHLLSISIYLNQTTIIASTHSFIYTLINHSSHIIYSNYYSILLQLSFNLIFQSFIFLLLSFFYLAYISHKLSIITISTQSSCHMLSIIYYQPCPNVKPIISPINQPTIIIINQLVHLITHINNQSLQFLPSYHLYSCQSCNILFGYL